jgi:hypothetical protein
MVTTMDAPSFVPPPAPVGDLLVFNPLDPRHEVEALPSNSAAIG